MNSKTPLRQTMDEILAQHPTLFDVAYDSSQRAFTIKMTRLDLLQNFDTVEVDITVNPQIQPAENTVLSSDYLCDPYEYYVRQNTNKDQERNIETSYTPIANSGKMTAGLITTALLSGMIAKFNPAELKNPETRGAGVLFFGLGAFGRTKNTEKFLINNTKKRRLQFKEQLYHYQKTMSGTRERYGDHTMFMESNVRFLKAEKMGMLIDRKEQNVRLQFTKDAIENVLTDNQSNEAHILRIQFKKDVIETLEKSGIYLGFHIKLGKKKHFFPLVKDNIEIIEGTIWRELHTDKIETGYIPRTHIKPKVGQIEIRETTSLGRVKYYKSFDEQKENIVKASVVKHTHNNENQKTTDSDIHSLATQSTSTN